jgi:hypothetical protein
VRRRALALCSLALSLVAEPARADFRVFEEHAPRRPAAPAEPPQGVAGLIQHELAREPAPETAADPETGSETEGEPEAERETGAETETTAATQVETRTETRTEITPEPEPERRPFLDDHRWLDITGFLQPGFIARFDDPSDGVSVGNTDETFWLQRARLGVRAQLFEWLRFRVEVEFTPTTSLQDGYVDIVPHPVLGLRAGQFIVPFLRTFQFNEVNLGYIDRALYTPVQFERGYLRYLAPRDMGLMFFGSVGDRAPSSHDPVLEYQLALMNGRGPNLPINDDFVFLYALRVNLQLFGVPVGADAESDIARNDHARLAIGAAGYSNCDDRGNWNRGVTFDAELRYEGLYASGAFVWLRNSGGEGTPLFTSERCNGTPGPTPGVSADFVSRAAHVQAQWAIPRVWADLGAPLDRMDLELLARFDWVDGNSPYDGNFLGAGGPSSPGYIVPTDYANPDNPPTRWRLTFGLNYFPTGQQTLKLGINYQLNREAEDVDTGMGIVRQVANDVLWLQATVAL